jgi:hypothetical protein
MNTKGTIYTTNGYIDYEIVSVDKNSIIIED